MLTAPLFMLITSFILVHFFIKKIIYIAHKKELYDEPTQSRKVHLMRIPNLGGAAIFGSFFIVCTLSPVMFNVPNLNYITLAATLLFIIGLADDLNAIDAWKKMAVQVIVAGLLSIAAGYRFDNAYGMFGIHGLGTVMSMLLSTAFIIFVINAFNLIDGIDCLAAGLGLLASIIFSICFHLAGAKGPESMTITLAGCLAAFIIFNKTPAKIFLGDSGSTFIGLLMAFFSILLVTLPSGNIARLTTISTASFFITLVLAILVVPVFDTVRIFYTRLSKGKSPFAADRNHLHHRLLDLGLSHLQSTWILIGVTLLNISIVVICRRWSSESLIVTMLLVTVGLNSCLSILHKARLKEITTRLATTRPAVNKGKVKILFNKRASVK